MGTLPKNGRCAAFLCGTSPARLASMKPRDLKVRTFQTAVETVRFVRGLPPSPETRELGRQLIRSSMSVPAQYRAARRAQSTRDFIAKLKRLEEEADESELWLHLLQELGLPPGLQRTGALLRSEFGELTAITVQSIKSARAKLAREAASLRAARSAQAP
jgi:four helix bundle protein